MAVAEIISAVGVGSALVERIRSGRVREADVQKLAVRYWGCALFELAANLHDLANHKGKGRLQLRFNVFNAIIGDLCRIDPSPLAIGQLNDVMSRIREWDEANQAAMDIQPRTSGTVFVPGPADLDLFGVTCDALCEQVRLAGRRAYGDEEWQQIEPEIVPLHWKSISTLHGRGRARAEAEAKAQPSRSPPGPNFGEGV